MPEQQKPINVRHTNPNNILPQYINEPVFSHSATEIFLSLYIIEPPLVFTPDELASITYTDAIAIGKFVMAPEVAEMMLERLKGTLEQFKQRTGRQ